MFLSSYRNTRESLGELEKAAETLACGSRCFHSLFFLNFWKEVLTKKQNCKSTQHIIV